MSAAETDVDTGAIDADTAAAARLTAARHATDATDLTMLLDMLGLTGDPVCRECGGELTPRRTVSTKSAGTLCAACRRTTRTPPPQRQRTPAPEKPPAPRCACGRASTVGDSCGRCGQYVPRSDLLNVVERIKRDTGMSTNAIAKRVGMLPSTLRKSVAPGNAHPAVKRSTYAKVLRLAEELSA